MRSLLLDFMDGLSGAKTELQAGEYLLTHFQNQGFLGGNIWFGTGEGNHRANNSITTYTKEFLEYQYQPKIIDNIAMPRIVNTSDKPYRCGWDIESKKYDKTSIDYEYSAVSLDAITRRNAIIFPIKTHGLPGNSGVSVISEMDRETFDAELEQKGPHLQQCAIATHTYMQILRRRALKIEPVAQLTDREKECLSWKVRGYSNYEIAEQMKISETRVNQLFRQARKRLNVKRSSEALLKAVLSGLISPQ